MSHNDAVETLKNLPKGRKWLSRQALDILLNLEKEAFIRRTDYAEAVTAAITGQRWESVSGRQGYDTANTLSRWLRAAPRQYRDTETLFDAKTQKQGIGYSDKVTERANKASHYLERRGTSHSVINGVIFHTSAGVFLQLGIDHEGTKPQFGSGKRPIVRPEDLTAWIDGASGILPAVLLTSRIRSTNKKGSDPLNLGGLTPFC